MNFAKFLRAPFLQNTSGQLTASYIKQKLDVKLQNFTSRLNRKDFLETQKTNHQMIKTEYSKLNQK